MTKSPNSWRTYKVRELIEEQLIEASYGPSETVPDQALSLQELLYNYSRGIPINQHQGEYLGDEYVPDFNTMDLAEIAEYREGLKEEIEDLQQRVKQSEKEAADKRKAALKGQSSPSTEPTEPTEPTTDEES